MAHLKEIDAFGGKGSRFQREAARLPLQGRQEDMDWVWKKVTQGTTALFFKAQAACLTAVCSSCLQMHSRLLLCDRSASI